MSRTKQTVRCPHCGAEFDPNRQRAQIVELSDGTRTAREIAAQVGCRLGIVTGYIKRLGLSV
jgi:hypothetical protein